MLCCQYTVCCLWTGTILNFVRSWLWWPSHGHQCDMGWIYRVFCMLFSNQSLLTVDMYHTHRITPGPHWHGPFKKTVILTFSRQCNVLYEKDKLSTQLRLACLEKQKNRVYYTGLRFSFFKILIKVRINERTVCLYWIKIKIGLKFRLRIKLD